MKLRCIAVTICVLIPAVAAAKIDFQSRKTKEYYWYAGNREQGLNLTSKNYFIDLYAQEDFKQKMLETGILVKVHGNDDSFLKVGAARMSRTSNLNSSLLLKLNYSTFSKPFRNVSEESTFGLGYFIFPGQIAYLPGYYTTLSESEKFICGRFKHRFSNTDTISFDLMDKYLMNWDFGLQGIVSKNANIEFMEMPLASFSYMNFFTGMDLHRRFYELWDLGVGYSDKVQTTSVQKLSPLRNQDVMVSISNYHKPVRFRVAYYEPLEYKMYRENYLYQDKRVEASLIFNFKKIDFKNELVYDKNDNAYTKSLFKYKSENSAYSLYYTKNMLDEIVGFNIELFSLFYNPKNRDYNYIDVKATNYVKAAPSVLNPTYRTETVFENLVQSLDTPDKVADYVGFKLTHIDSNNGPLGYLTGISKPIEVFTQGGGNNTEQMGFASYILKQHKYESYILSFVTPNVAHSYSAYKDKATGKWMAIDYGSIINSAANTPEDIVVKSVPNWLSIEIKNPEDCATEKHIDSMTKWLILDWFEKD